MNQVFGLYTNDWFFTLGVAYVRESVRTRYMGHGGTYFIRGM